MPTATTTTEDSRSKLVQNHPHDFTMKQKKVGVELLRLNMRSTALSIHSDWAVRNCTKIGTDTLYMETVME
jgi:hypothetical protein